MFCLTPFRLLAFNAVYTFALTNAISQVDERPMVLEVDGTHYQDTARLSDYCSNIKYLPLDPAENISIGHAHRIKIIGDVLLVLEYEEFKRLRGFSVYTGKKLFEISNLRGGHDGLGHPLGFYYDVHRRRVEIFDAGGNELLFYDLHGVYLKSIKLDFFVADFTKNDNGDYFIYTGGAIRNGKEKNINETLIITDSTFHVKGRFFESNSNRQKLFIRSLKNFSWRRGDLYFWGSPDARVFRVREAGVQAVFALDFKQRNLPEDMKQNRTGMTMSDWIDVVRTNDYYLGVSGHFGNDHLELFRFISVKERRKYYVSIDRRNKMYYYFDEDRLLNDIDKGLVGEIIHLDDEYLITLIDAATLKNHLSKNPDIDNTPFKDLPGVWAGYANPILMFNKLK